MSETSMKKLLTILSIRSRRYWQRLQALDLYLEADQYLRRRQQRRRGRQALGLDVLSPVLFFSGVVFDACQRVVDVAWIYYRADRFTFALDLDVSR